MCEEQPHNIFQHKRLRLPLLQHQQGGGKRDARRPIPVLNVLIMARGSCQSADGLAREPDVPAIGPAACRGLH